MNTPKFLAIALALVLLQQSAHAAIVTNNLSGNVEYDGWDSLTSITPGLSTATLVSGFGSNEAGSGDAVLTRTSGFHYPASASLYSFQGDSTLKVADTSALSDVKTVVFSILTWPNPDHGDGSTAAGSINTGPTLNFNGGSQSLPADYTGAYFNGQFTGGGFDVPSYAYTFQWDLSSEGAITSYEVEWGQIVHAGVLALQLESADVFSISAAVVPEPASLALVGLGLAGCLARRRRLRSE